MAFTHLHRSYFPKFFQESINSASWPYQAVKGLSTSEEPGVVGEILTRSARMASAVEARRYKLI